MTQLARSGLIDRDYYAFQTGMRFRSTRAAARHYLTTGEPAGLAPNRLFEPEWFRAKARLKSK